MDDEQDITTEQPAIISSALAKYSQANSFKVALKHQQFAKAYIANGFNGMRAYKEVYPDCSLEAARASAPAILAKSSVREQIVSTLEQLGVTQNKALQPVADALQATQNEGVIDHNIRLKATDMYLKIMGGYAADQHPTEEHKHLHIESTQSPQLMRFLALNGRYPSEAECKQLGIPWEPAGV